VPIEKQLNVYHGDVVRAGDILVDGTIDVRDVLRIMGGEKAAAHAMDEVQKVYRAQGVEINDKHLEVILRKMLGKVQIVYAGDTDFVAEEIVSREVFLQENEKTRGRKATAKQLILSLTNTALQSDSWLSGASFQSTTAVLANAALRKRTDNLHGTKENIIVGNIVPVGTGHQMYRKTYLVPEKSAKETREETKRSKAYEKFLSLFKED
jgi:DNA-directed RNA polymerase subunit beta'